MPTTPEATAYTIISMAEKFQDFFYGNAGDVTFSYMDNTDTIRTTTVPNVKKLTTQLDVANVSESELNTVLSDYYSKTAMNSILTGFYDKEAVDNIISNSIELTPMTKATFMQNAFNTRSLLAGSGVVDWGGMYFNPSWSNRGLWSFGTGSQKTRSRLNWGRYKDSVTTGGGFPIISLGGKLVEVSGQSNDGSVQVPQIGDVMIIDDIESIPSDAKQGEFAILKSNNANIYKFSGFANDGATIESTPDDLNWIYTVTDSAVTHNLYLTKNSDRLLQRLIKYRIKILITDNPDNLTELTVTVDRTYNAGIKPIVNGVVVFDFYVSGESDHLYITLPNTGDTITISKNVEITCLEETRPIVFKNDLPVGTNLLDNYGKFNFTDTVTRQDLMFIEGWEETIYDPDAVTTDFFHPYGNVMFNGANLLGGQLVDGAFIGSDTYSLPGNWLPSGSIVGRGKVWSTLTFLEKQEIFNSPEHRVYVDGNKVKQYKFRHRGVKGLGNEWINIDLLNSGKDSYRIVRYSGDYALKPQGSAFNIASGKELSYDDGESGSFYTGPSNTTCTVLEKGLWYNCAKEISAIPLTLIQKRNRYVYHPTFNPTGSALVYSAGNALYHYESESIINSILDCFDPDKVAVKDGLNISSLTQLNAGLLSDSYTITGTLDSQVSGRDDGLYSDELVETDITDLRMSAERRSPKEILDITKEELSANDVIFTEKGDFLNVGKKHGVVLDLGASGDTDDAYMYKCSVIQNNDLYEMWYTGHDGVTSRIHRAISTDGINWDKKGVVVSPDISSDNNGLSNPTVLLDGTTYKMWYAGTDGTYRIHYATSVDGITWVKQGVVLVENLEGVNDISQASFPSVVKDGATYKMWYVGTSNGIERILYSTSVNGIDWITPILVVDVGINATTDDRRASSVCVVKDGPVYRMLYSGHNDVRFRVHYAISTDGINWDKKGVVLSEGNHGETDTVHLSRPSFVISSDGTLQTWYSGYGTDSKYRIHYAELFNLNSLDNIANYRPYVKGRVLPKTGHILRYTSEVVRYNKTRIINFVNKNNGKFSGELNTMIVKSYGGKLKPFMSVISVSKVLITKASGEVIEGTFTYTLARNEITVSNLWNTLGYSDIEDMYVNMDIKVVAEVYTEVDAPFTHDRHTVSDTVVSVTTNSDNIALFTRKLNTIQQSTAVRGIDTLGIKSMNIANRYNDYTIVEHSPLDQLSINNNSSAVIKMAMFMTDTGKRHNINMLIEEAEFYNGGKNVYDGVASGKLFGSTGSTLYKNGLVLDLGINSLTDDTHLNDSSVLFVDGLYRIWYSGYDGARYRIHYAISPDGVSWTKHNVVLNTGLTGSDDSTQLREPCVIYDNGVYKIWYSGRGAVTYNIMYATSPDGVTWTKEGTVVSISSTLSESVHVKEPFIIKRNGIYYMWYTGSGDGVTNHHATSTDGITWVKQGKTVILDLNGTAYTAEVSQTIVSVIDNVYYMWFSRYYNSGYSVFVCTSPDGITWTVVTDGSNNPVPVLEPSSAGLYDDLGVRASSIVSIDGATYLWYAGLSNNGTGNKYRIHVASTELLTFDNPTGIIDDGIMSLDKETLITTTETGARVMSTKLSIPTRFFS